MYLIVYAPPFCSKAMEEDGHKSYICWTWFYRPSGLRFTKAHVTHPELKCTFNLEIIGVKKNPNGPMYTSLGVMTKGTIIEVFIFLLF